MNKVYQKVGGLTPGRSVFDLSYEKKFDCDMGQIIPVMADEAYPGDIFKIACQLVIRFQPLVAPILHSISVFVYYFFCPYRKLWDEWEDFITGGVDGEYSAELPRWNPTSTALLSLWDYFGFPVGVTPTGRLPMQFPLNAYNWVYNEYFRDETLHLPVDLDDDSVKNCCWEKDYFTSALLDPQRGPAMALPISGTSAAEWAAAVNVDEANSYAYEVGYTSRRAQSNSGGSSVTMSGSASSTTALRLHAPITAAALGANTVDLSGAGTFDVNDIRTVFQVQKWLERNARAGYRYIEQLKSHFGKSPRDERLQRPEFIGGVRMPVIISEVLKTSSTDGTSPQGNLAGHGIVVDRKPINSYHVEEHGLIMGLMFIRPEADYMQGIDRQWLRQSRYDFMFPEFVNLGEQAVENVEVYATNVAATNIDTFGYQGRYNELRSKRNMICGNLRDSLDHWHLGRQFSSLPTLSSSFVEISPAQTKRIFAATSQPGLIVDFGNIVKAIRPIPMYSEPGLLDHN